MRDRTKCINQPSVLPFIRFLGVGFIALILSACGSGSDTGQPVANNSIVSTGVISDMQIAQALYFDERTPAGFYREDFQDGNYYSISHVKNVDLLPLVNRGGLPVYELASDDFVEAMDWSEQAAGNQLNYKQLVDNSETELYHQFTRMDPAAPQFITLSRVFKSSVLDRSGVDQNQPGNYQGRITLTETTAEQLKLIIEYLWTFTDNNNFGNAVLASYATETEDEFVHIMLQAKLNMSYSTSCDTIEVYEIRYTVPKASGFIWKDEVITRVISARRTGSRLEICQ